MSAADRGYVALLRRPGALPLFLWVNLARLVYGALPLVLLLLVAGRRGSYADAGVTLAVFSIPGFLGPARARLVDRLGARRVLVALALGLFLAVTGLDLLAGGPLVVVLGLALLAGCTPPPVGPLMRAAWRELSGGDPDVLRRAYSLDSVGEDVLFVLGPLVAAAAASTSGASTLVPALAAVLVVAALGIGSCRPVGCPRVLRHMLRRHSCATRTSWSACRRSPVSACSWVASRWPQWQQLQPWRVPRWPAYRLPPCPRAAWSAACCTAVAGSPAARGRRPAGWSAWHRGWSH